MFLPRINRYQGQVAGDFFRRAHKTHLPFGLIYYLARPELKVPQFVVVTGKKHFPKSHQRHQVKRHLHTWLKTQLALLQPGLYVLVIHQLPDEKQLDHVKIHSD